MTLREPGLTLLMMGPHDSQSSRENANPSSGTSPLASNKKVPPPGQAVYEKIKITSKQKTVDYRVSIAQLRVVSPFRLGNSIAGSLAPFTWNKSEVETIWLQNKVVWL